jgi:hypothetical protein
MPSFAPLYQHHRGQVAGGRRFDFFAVITPHMREQTHERAQMTVDRLLAHHGIRLSQLWFLLEEGTCHYVNVGSRFLLYCKRKYNARRSRWELELITLTPPNHAHTHKLRFAKPVCC